MSHADADTENGSAGWTASDSAPLLLTAGDVAALLQVRASSVEYLHQTGQLKGVLVARNLRWRPADVRAYVAGLGGDS